MPLTNNPPFESFLIIVGVINTPGKNRHQLFVDFVRRFCRLFPERKSCLSADQSADILGSGNVRAADGQMDREDALGATMQEFNRPEKPAIWICWENLLKFGSNLSFTRWEPS